MTGVCPAAAQSPLVAQDIDKELLDAPKRITDIDDTTREALEKRRDQPARIVTYADVLANPDDIDINLAYAKVQIARGDVKGAAATYERILLIDPDLPRVRLLYAVILFRLDNLNEAERELIAVREQEMPPTLRAEIDHYLKKINLRRKQTRYTFTASFGAQHDWNRNASPASKRQLVSDFVADVDEADLRTRDIGYNALTDLRVVHDLGYQAKHRLNGALTHYRGLQRKRGELDLKVFAAEFGGVYAAGAVSLHPTLFGQRINLSKELYSFVHGARLRAEHRIDADLDIYGYGQAERKEYFAVTSSLTAPERTGWQYMAALGANYKLNPAMKMSFEISGISVGAERNYNAYTGKRATLSHKWLLGDGMFLITALTGELDRYQEGDPEVSELTRHDFIGKAGLTFGVPVDFFCRQ